MTTAQAPHMPRLFLELVQAVVSGNPTHVPCVSVVCGVYLDEQHGPSLSRDLEAELGRSFPRERVITHAITITLEDFEIHRHRPADSQAIAAAVSAELDRRTRERRRSTSSDAQ